MVWLWCAGCLFCVWQINGSSEEERYSRFRGEPQGLTVVVDNTQPRDEDRRGRPRHRENPDGGWRDQTSLAERRHQERRELRDRATYRPYPGQNQGGSRQEWLRGQRHGRREVSRSQRDRENRQKRGRARERELCQRDRRHGDTHGRPGMGVSHGQELSTHVQCIVWMGAETVSAPERVPSPPSVRQIYLNEPSQVVRASFSQFRGFGGTLPSHEQMISGPSTSTSVDEPSQVIRVSFTQLGGYGGMPPSDRQMIGGPLVSATVPVVSSTPPVGTPASAPG